MEDKQTWEETLPRISVCEDNIRLYEAGNMASLWGLDKDSRDRLTIEIGNSYGVLRLKLMDIRNEVSGRTGDITINEFDLALNIVTRLRGVESEAAQCSGGYANTINSLKGAH